METQRPELKAYECDGGHGVDLAHGAAIEAGDEVLLLLLEGGGDVGHVIRHYGGCIIKKLKKSKSRTSVEESLEPERCPDAGMDVEDASWRGGGDAAGC